MVKATLGRLIRRARYGAPIVIVSGLPRSGTSLMMQMLEAGGVEIVTDRVRGADESNPNGYYELETVKSLEQNTDHRWLAEARGRAVKIISFLLRFLPDTYNYDVIFMQRDMDEVLASQAKLLARRGEDSSVDEGQMRQLFEEDLRRTKRVLSSRACFRVLTIDYRDVIRAPEEGASRVVTFLGEPLEIEAMAGVVDPELYRNRRAAHATR